MATFVLTCLDYLNALDRRMGAREAHLAYVADNRATVRLAGPLLDETGDMAGSMFIVEAESKADVEAFHAKDPYKLANVFETVTIRPMKITVGAIA